jgi:hypothetical protein
VASEMDDHPNGKCCAIPMVAGVADPTWETGKQWFEKLTPAEQEAKMGPGMFAAWKDGKIELSDLAAKQHSDVWGDSPAVPSLQSLLGGKGETGGEALGATIETAIDRSGLPLARGANWTSLRREAYRDTLLEQAAEDKVGAALIMDPDLLDRLNDIAVNAKLANEETVYFGLDGAKFKGMKPGETFNALGTRSTSSNLSRALSYQGEGGVFEVVLPKGTHAAWGYDKIAPELKEIVLLPNSKFEVLSTRNGVTRLRLLDDGADYTKGLWQFGQSLDRAAGLGDSPAVPSLQSLLGGKDNGFPAGLDALTYGQREDKVVEWLQKEMGDTSPYQAVSMAHASDMHTVTYKGTTIRFEDTPDSMLAAAKTIGIAEEGAIPAKLLNQTHEWVFTGQRDRKDADTANRLNMPGFKALASAGQGKITVFNNDPLRVSTLAHELAHNTGEYYDLNTFGPFLKLHTDWLADKTKEEPVSPYGMVTAGEDWAEAVGLYVINPGMMRRVYPSRFTIIDKLFGGKK